MQQAKTTRAMPGDVKEVKFCSEDFLARPLVEQLIGCKSLDFQCETKAPESIRARDQGQGVRMNRAVRPVPSQNFRAVQHMVEMPVGQEEKVYLLLGKVRVGPVRGVNEQISLRQAQEKAVCLEDAARKRIELQHKIWVEVVHNSNLGYGSIYFPSHMTAFAALIRSVLLTSVLLVGFWPGACGANTSTDYGQIATAVARMLEQGHYTRQKLDPQLSAKFFENYLRLLDYNRMYLLESDVEEFRQKYEKTLCDKVLQGDLTPAEEIFARFKQRVEERVAKNLKLVHEPFTFKSDREVEINRQKAPWPKDMAEADRLWRARVEYELLQENLTEARLDPPEKVLTRRYNQILRNVREQEQEDIVKTFLTALAQTYDPHSDYMSPSDMENFAIAMRLSLVGVGAVLRSDEGYARVVEVVPGGPADRDGRLKTNDRIAAVAQGDGEFEDVVDMKLDKVVEKIRGPKGTKVRLLVVPANATDPSKREVIEIVRDEVKLKDQEAKAELIILPGKEGKPETRIGWISLPSFYANMSPEPGSPPKSTTADVSRLLNRLTQEGIDGLIIDLRKDGGGSLEEAINLTGLFIPEGPVVQVKNANGQVAVNHDRSGRTLYTGPLVVLMNRLSASASEIFAAALQDYGRALIVGDERSFGKGTVQQLIDVGRFMPFFSLSGADAGSLKLTVQKFYRVKGGSTQLNGVESDIVLPSLSDTSEIGESALPHPLAYDEVAPRAITPWPLSPFPFLEELRQRSAARIAKEPEFQYIAEDRQRILDRLAANRISLNKSRRKAELDAEKARREERNMARRERGPAIEAKVYEITLDSVEAPELVEVPLDRKPKSSAMLDPEAAEEEIAESAEENLPTPDAIRVESLLIVRDLIELQGNQRTARVEATTPS